MPGVGERPPGAEFYPHDMTKEEFERPPRRRPRRRGAAEPVHRGPPRQRRAAVRGAVPRGLRGRRPGAPRRKLREAAALAEDPGLRQYLELRARALETDEYQPSDLAWMDMKTNTRRRRDRSDRDLRGRALRLQGRRTRRTCWSRTRSGARGWPATSQLLPGAAARPAGARGVQARAARARDSDLNAYDALYYAGDSNAGSKTIAINLPNDEEVQLRKGTRRLQLKNAMRAKFDKILVPIADELIAADQQAHITFDAFFANVMFHEVAHGLGIKNTIDGKGTVRAALKEQAGALEEGKADILGLYMVTRLLEQQASCAGTALEDNYVTFLASIFRSVRFGATEAHGRANAAQFSYFARARRVRPRQRHGTLPRGLPEDAAGGRLARPG